MNIVHTHKYYNNYIVNRRLGASGWPVLVIKGEESNAQITGSITEDIRCNKQPL